MTTEAKVAEPRAGAYRALRNRNVQLYMAGMLVSQVGNYMQGLAQGWLIYQITNSAFSLGYVGFLAALPIVPWNFVAGSLADRMPRLKLLILALLGEALFPFLLALDVLSGHVKIWHIILFSVLMGATTTLDFVSRVPIIYSIVDREDVENGLAVTASLMNIARVVGPAVAGFSIAIWGVAGSFLFNSFSFLFVLAMLLIMKIPKQPRAERPASVASHTWELVVFIFRDRPTLIFLSMVVVASTFVLPYQTLLPVFARDILVVGPQGLGLLTSAGGVGAIIASVFLASRSSISANRRFAFAMTLMILLGPALAAFAFSRNIYLSCLLLALVTGGFVSLRIISYTYIHLRTADAMRGRMTSVLQMGMTSSATTGGLLAGWVASHLGSPISIAAGGAICLVFGLFTLAFVFPRFRSEEPPAGITAAE